MRKIGSEKERERKKKRNVALISVFMLGVLILGTVGYGFIAAPLHGGGSDESIQEGKFVQLGDRWATSRNNQILYFTNSPSQVQDIQINATVALHMYAGAPLYLVSENDRVNQEIATTLGRYTARVQTACFGACEENLPEKDCTENLIIWQDNTENKIYQDNKCVFIEGDLRAVDAFLFRVLGLEQ